MKNSLAGIVLVGLLAVVSVATLVLWFPATEANDLSARMPGMDRPEGPRTAVSLTPPVAGEPVHSDVTPAELPGSWPCFRGPMRDGMDHESVSLARKWPEEGPEVLWTVELGPGHAGAAVAEGCVYVLDYSVAAKADTMRCLSLADGREIWHNSYPIEVVENHGMSRTVPAVGDGRVVSIGPKCHVACWDTASGECHWLMDMVIDYQTMVPEWYTAQCPLIDDGRVILAPSGRAFLIAVDLASGEVLWESPAVSNWMMTHVSILPMEFAGQRMYVYCGSGGVAAVSADDGSLLWQTTDWVGNMATCPTPIHVGDGRIFFCGGYKAGSLMIELTETGGELVPKTLFRLGFKEFDSEQQTPILYNDHLFGVVTKDAREQLVCLDLEGHRVWDSGSEKFGRGPYMLADGLFYVLHDRGLLTVAEATTAGYRPLDQFQVFEHGHDAWGPMAMADGKLIVRDLTRMTCLDVAAR